MKKIAVRFDKFPIGRRMVEQFCLDNGAEIHSNADLLITDSVDRRWLTGRLTENQKLVIIQLVDTAFINPAFDLAYQAQYGSRFRMYFNVARNNCEMARLMEFLHRSLNGVDPHSGRDATGVDKERMHESGARC